MIPKFFGEPPRQLFGVYHPPEADSREVGVVLCNPGPQDYRHTHWSFRKLAGLLAKEGFHVLRFDYFATGDSAGDSSEASVDQWTNDIATASRELQDTASLRRVSLVGMRLGAVLAVRACSNGLPIEDLVLWEPVVLGSVYLDELDRAHDLSLLAQRYPQDNRRAPEELLGYRMTPELRDSIREIDLTEENSWRPRRLLVVSAQQRLHDRLLIEVGRKNGVDVGLQVVDDHMLYPGGEPGFILVAHNIPHAITAFLARRRV